MRLWRTTRSVTASRPAALVALNAIAFALLLAQYFGSGLAARPLALRHSSEALATAVTDLRGIARDSTYAIELYMFFYQAGPALTDAQLRESLTLPVLRPHERLVYSRTNDQGKPAFFKASFQLFGVRLSAPHQLFFALLGASLLLFVAAHWRDPAALGLALFAVLSLHAMVFVLTLSSQLWTAIDVRFFSTLAILPCLALAVTVTARRWSWPAQLLAAPQAALIAGVCQVRMSAAWTIVCLILLAGWTVVACRTRGSFAAATAPLLVTGALFVTFAAYQRQHMTEQDRHEVLSRHVFWHSLHTGFAANPALARQYQLGFADLPSYLAVMRDVAVKDPDRMQAIFGTKGFDFQVIRVNWHEYEPAARAVVWRMVRKEPRAVITAFLYDKPLMFIRTLEWATGWSDVPVQAIAMEPEWLSTPAERRASDAYLRWFRPIPACLVLLATALVAWRRGPPLAPAGSPWLVVPVMFVTSLIPALFVWPAFHWSADALVMAGVLVYTVPAWGLVTIGERTARPGTAPS
jgi:hypothetical protein